MARISLVINMFFEEATLVFEHLPAGRSLVSLSNVGLGDLNHAFKGSPDIKVIKLFSINANITYLPRDTFKVWPLVVQVQQIC